MMHYILIIVTSMCIAQYTYAGHETQLRNSLWNVYTYHASFNNNGKTANMLIERCAQARYDVEVTVLRDAIEHFLGVPADVCLFESKENPDTKVKDAACNMLVELLRVASYSSSTNKSLLYRLIKRVVRQHHGLEISSTTLTTLLSTYITSPQVPDDHKFEAFNTYRSLQKNITLIQDHESMPLFVQRSSFTHSSKALHDACDKA